MSPEDKKLGQQLTYADRRGFQVAIISGEDEFASGVCQIKDWTTGNTESAALGDDAGAVVAALAGIVNR